MGYLRRVPASLRNASTPGRRDGWRLRLIVCTVKAGRGAPPEARDGAVPLAPSTAEEAVNLGLSLYKKKKVTEALAAFDGAMALGPSSEEAQAALFNKACCHATRGEGRAAQVALRDALGKHGLPFSTILSDPDLAPFRALPEFRALQEEARKGGADIGDSFRRDLKLISEVQAPFRGVRKFLYLGGTAAAAIGTLFTGPQLVRALAGGEGAPPLVQTAFNMVVNVGGAAALVALFRWDQRQEEAQMARVSRDETLSRLPLRLGAGGRVAELAQLRGSSRPIILAGRRESVEAALKAAERWRKELLDRGALLVPLVWRNAEPAAPAASRQRKGFGAAALPPTPAAGNIAGDLDDFEARAKEVAGRALTSLERRSKAEAVSPGEWELWVREQQEAQGLAPGEDVYIVLRLDGRIRASGRGMPNWAELTKDLPVLENILSKLER